MKHTQTIFRHRKKLNVQEVGQKDEESLVALLRSTTLIHRHFGWVPPLNWLGKQPFLSVFKNRQILAALACPPDPPQIAWIRLFASDQNLPIKEAWHLLWPLAQKKLKKTRPTKTVAAIVLQDWLQEVLQESGFTQECQVSGLTRKITSDPLPNIQSEALIRAMQKKDLPVVQKIDEMAFAPFWRTPPDKLEYAHNIAVIATVAEINQQIIGYQISTGDTLKGHLARLAVSPQHQNRGIGKALLHDLLTKFEQQRYIQITVNTQTHNKISQKLYQSFGFQLAPETYPVYQIQL